MPTTENPGRSEPARHSSAVGIAGPMPPAALGGLDQAHDGRGGLARPQRSCEQPVGFSDGDWPDLDFHPVVTRHSCSAPSISPGGAEPSAEYPPLTGTGGDGSMSCGQAGVRQ